jgi:hypothetical protein
MCVAIVPQTVNALRMPEPDADFNMTAITYEFKGATMYHVLYGCTMPLPQFFHMRSGDW